MGCCCCCWLIGLDDEWGWARDLRGVSVDADGGDDGLIAVIMANTDGGV